MKQIVLVLVFAAVAHAQNLESIEIVGPAAVLEQTETAYQCIAHFDNGDVDVTTLAAWAVEPIGDIEDGLLTIGDLDQDQPLVLSASWTFGDQTVEATLDVLADANDLNSIEIVGPDLVFGQSETAFQCIANFDVGDEDVTLLADWSIVPNGPAAIDQGLLSTGAVANPVDVVLMVSYQWNEDVFEATHEVHVARQPVILESPSEQGARFGTQLAFADSTMVVGDVDAADFHGQGGAAYLYDMSTPGEPMYVAALHGEGLGTNDHFGAGVAISGDLVLACGRGTDAYVYESATGAGVDQWAGPYRSVAATDDLIVTSTVFGLLDVIDGHTLESLGTANVGAGLKKVAIYEGALDIEGSTIAVGISGFDAGFIDFSKAFVVDVSDPADPSVIELQPDPPLSFTFGKAVAIEGGLVLVSASSAERVYLFEAATGLQVGTIEAAQPTDEFGWSLALAGSVAYIGDIDRERVYRYDVSDPSRPQLLGVLASGGDNDAFGSSVAVDGEVVLVGARKYGDAGAVFVYDRSTCRPDLNGDGSLNILDFVSFQQMWQAHASTADCNGDGALDILDFVCFQGLFLAGCD